MKILCLAFAMLASTSFSGLAGAASGSAARVPVLLELFTSEGCSSCPPADRLLEALDRDQPEPGADLIVISEHVDYWNHLGWADPYSSAFYSARQREYADRLHLDSVYTPQLVVDGRAELVGSDHRKASEAIAKAARESKLPLGITVTPGAGNVATVSLTSPGVPDRRSHLYIVVASDHARSQVSRGENAGRQLSHVAVARSFAKAAYGDTQIRLPAGAKPGETRVIAFVQDAATGQILGVAQARM